MKLHHTLRPALSWPRAAGRLAAAAAVALAGPAAAATPTLFFELATPQKDLNFTAATGLNNQGQAVGWSTVAGESTAVPLQAVFWGGPVAAPVILPGTQAARGTARDINTAAQIAGGIAGTAVQWAPVTPAPAYGLPQALAPLPGGKDFVATGINDGGSVVGTYWKCQAADCSTGNTRAWLWDAANGMQSIGPNTGFWTYAQAVNQAGDVLLTNTDANNVDRVQVRQAAGRSVDARAINEAGWVVGSALGSDGSWAGQPVDRRPGLGPEHAAGAGAGGRVGTAMGQRHQRPRLARRRRSRAGRDTGLHDGAGQRVHRPAAAARARARHRTDDAAGPGRAGAAPAAQRLSGRPGCTGPSGPALQPNR
jgi:hypothetical protein